MGSYCKTKKTSNFYAFTSNTYYRFYTLKKGEIRFISSYSNYK